MLRRRFTPKTRAQNERMIQKDESNWGKGLITDFDETPIGALSELENAIDFGTEIRGRKGSVLYNAVKNKIVVDDTVAIAAAVANGDFDAVVASDGYFIVYDFKDYTDNPLSAAKIASGIEDATNLTVDGYLVRPYDIFTISGSITTYIGNLSVPTIYYGRWNLDNPEDAVGHYALEIGTGLQEITSYNQDGTYSYGSSQTLAVETNIAFRPVASYFDEKDSIIFIHCGTKMYFSRLPHYGWKEVPILKDEDLSIEYGNFNQQGSNVFYSNSSGIFRIRVSVDNIYGWKINEVPSDYLVNADKIKTFALADPDGNFPTSLVEKYEDTLVELSGVATESATGSIANDGGYFVRSV